MGLYDIGVAKDTAEITIYNPTNMRKPLTNDDGSPMTVTLYSPYSTTYKAVQLDVQRRRLEIQSATGMELDASEFEEMAGEIALRTIASWNITTKKGDTPAFSIDLARKLFEELPWFRDQVIGGQSRVTNFLEPSKPH